jgi:hypothetical protein
MAYVTKANFANVQQKKPDFCKWKRPLIEDNLNRDLIFDDWQEGEFKGNPRGNLECGKKS